MFFSGFVNNPVNKSQLDTVCEGSSPMTLEILKRHAVEMAFIPEAPIRLYHGFGVNLKILWRIRKVLDGSSGDYKGSAAPKPHPGHSGENSHRKLSDFFARSRP